MNTLQSLPVKTKLKYHNEEGLLHRASWLEEHSSPSTNLDILDALFARVDGFEDVESLIPQPGDIVAAALCVVLGFCLHSIPLSFGGTPCLKPVIPGWNQHGRADKAGGIAAQGGKVLLRPSPFNCDRWRL